MGKPNTNPRKFYVTDEVLEILFDFLKKNDNLTQLKNEINDRIIDENTNKVKNTINTPHPKKYFDTINEKIEKIENFIHNKTFDKLDNQEQTLLAELLYQLEDLAEDKVFFPENQNNNNKQHHFADIITQLHVIKTLSLPILEGCTYHYDDKDYNKQTNINLVQDFNFLQKHDSFYKFYQFYPFDDKSNFKTEEEAVNFHYETMAENYFTYLKELIDKNPNTFFVCYKPGVKAFANDKETDNENIQKIFTEAFNKLDDKYKQHIMFCVNSIEILTKQQVGYRYNYTLDELQTRYPNNEFLKTAKNIQYVNGVARDPFVKIGNEGRKQANSNKVEERFSTDDLFVKNSNEVEILYDVKIQYNVTDTREYLKNLVAKQADIHIQHTKYYKNVVSNILKGTNTEQLSKQDTKTLRTFIKRTYNNHNAYFYYTEKERKENALIDFANNNITSLNELNTIMKNIKGWKCAWCCCNY